MNTQPAIRVEHLTKRFLFAHEKRTTVKDHVVHLFRRNTREKLDVLTDISFDVAPGEWLGIVGKNGTGKSTLLRILAGIYQPDSGRVHIDGSLVPFLELGVGFNHELPARDNIFINGILMGMSRARINEKFDEIVSFAEVERFADMPIKNYSSGMLVKLAFSIAIQAEADIYLLDEVLAVGDFVFQQKCRDVFAKFRQQKKTIIFISHSMEAVRELCQRVIWLEKGKIKAIGSDVTKITVDYVEHG